MYESRHGASKTPRIVGKSQPPQSRKSPAVVGKAKHHEGEEAIREKAQATPLMDATREGGKAWGT